MNLVNERYSSHSINSAGLSNNQSNCGFEDSDIKRMEAKLLMDHYHKNSQHRNQKYEQEIQHKNNYAQIQQNLSKNYLDQIQTKKRKKDQIKISLANQYDEMIRLKYQKIKSQKQSEKLLQRKNLQLPNWSRNNQEDIVRRKKIQSQYGKQLEMHIQLQQLRKQQQKIRERQSIEKYKKQQIKQNINFDHNIVNQYKKRQQFEIRQNQILGVNEINPELYHSEILPSDIGNIRNLKKQQQEMHGIGLDYQIKKTISPIGSPRILQDTSKGKRISEMTWNSQQMSRSQVYNPITNPIQIKYKNPNVLRMLAEFN